MTAHELKTWPQFFRRVWDGTKTFEIRRDDRNFAVGDVLFLREYDAGLEDKPCGERYTGRELTANVVYALRGYAGIEDGYVLLGIERLQRASSRLPTAEVE